MVTPKKGVYDSLTLNAEGRRVAETWDPAKDEAAGEQCRAYGAANIMRVPGRLHITWQDDNTLRIDSGRGHADAPAAIRRRPPPQTRPRAGRASRPPSGNTRAGRAADLALGT